MSHAATTTTGSAQPAQPSHRAEPAPEAASGRSVLVLAAVFAVALLATVLGALTGLTSLRTAGALVAMVVGFGSAPLALLPRLEVWTRLGLTVVVGFSVLVIGALTMAYLHAWHPVVLFVVVAVAAAALHAAGVQAALRTGTSLGRRPAGRGMLSVSTLCTAAGSIVWLIAAFAGRGMTPPLHGFVAQISPLWFVGLALLLAGLVTSHHEREAALAVTALVLALTVTPALVYGMPRSQSAGKHVELVQYLRAGRHLQAENIYQSWSGFFAAAAWLCDVAGIRDPLRLATWWPVLAGVCRLVTFRYLAGVVLGRGVLPWVAVAIGVLADAIGADYFSPQSLGFVLALAIFALALEGLHDRHRLGTRTVLLILLGGCALAPTHQLTPYIVFLVLTVLVAFSLVRPWWTPLLVLGPAVGWALWHHLALDGYLSLGALGDRSNFRPPKTTGSAGLERLPVVLQTTTALLVGAFVLCLGALIALILRRDRTVWAFGVCAAAGLVPVAVNSYGNEGAFRAMLFAFPWLALLTARVVAGPQRVRWAPLAVVAPVLTASFLLATFGMDASNVVRGSDVTVTRQFRATAAPGSALLLLGQGDLPSAVPEEHTPYVYLRRTDISDPVLQRPLSEPATEATRTSGAYLFWGRTHQKSPDQLYAVWSPAAEVYGRAYGIQTREQFRALRTGLLADPGWKVVSHEGESYLFRHVASAAGTS